MPTLVILMLSLFGGGIVWGIERYKKANYIAKIIDGTAVSGDYVSENCKKVLDQLLDTKTLKYSEWGNYLELPDKQKIGSVVDSMTNFKNHSELTFTPSPTEWEILKGIVKKIVDTHI